MDEIFEHFQKAGSLSFRKLEVLDWIYQNFKVYDSGKWKEFSFDKHEPLKELYEFWQHPHLTIRKGVQVGVTTYGIARSLYAGDRMGIATAYFFPTNTHSEIFVNSKFTPTVNLSEYLSSLKKEDDTDNKRLKIFKNFYIHFGGVESATNVRSITVDHLVKDEVDEANQENLKFADDRLLHSQFGWITELSQPTLPEFGIDASFKKSDQRFWGIKCSKCRTDNFIDETFPECIVFHRGSVYYGCIKCRKRLDVANGRWIPKFKDRSKFHRGYHLSQLICSFRTPEQIYKQYSELDGTTAKKNFSISVLGMPFATPGQVPITLEVIKRAERDFGMEERYNASYFGMDVGDKCHIVFGHYYKGALRVHWVEEIDADNENGIIRLINKHKILGGVVDAMPYKTLSKNIARSFRGRVWIQYFKNDTLKTGLEGEDENEVLKVNINRTESLDETCDLLKEAKIELPAMKNVPAELSERYSQFRTHLLHLTKEPVERANGVLEYQYKRKAQNHFGMALNSMVVAYKLSKNNRVSGIEPVWM
ncbi:MAG: phage terminase large subunit family protein [Leptospiraceae bacterium]|nr:phage terminase large subunit family protein [Leptospiraceae bacterium]MCP5502639.1 phage terminase large subunit family protein [Leptospiraceae bacterium]